MQASPPAALHTSASLEAVAAPALAAAAAAVAAHRLPLAGSDSPEAARRATRVRQRAKMFIDIAMVEAEQNVRAHLQRIGLREDIVAQRATDLVDAGYDTPEQFDRLRDEQLERPRFERPSERRRRDAWRRRHGAVFFQWL
mgnify:CR=1 FL=1